MTLVSTCRVVVRRGEGAWFAGLSKCTTGQTFPEPASRLTNVGRQNGCVPRLGSVYKETVGKGASGGVIGIFPDADGAEFGEAAVDVPVDEF